MSILNIAGYKFLPLSGLNTLKVKLLSIATGLKGTILLSTEGININLAGATSSIQLFQEALKQDPRFFDLHFNLSYSENIPFQHLKIKIKKEIITFRQENVRPEQCRAPVVSPKTLKQWLDEGRNITILDTRNDFEVEMGAFNKAIPLNLKKFTDFPTAAAHLEKQTPVVMYCTGGIRCEKASLHLLNEGFSEVYQLEGGILNYFTQVGSAHFEGDCFVFDERIAVKPAKEQPWD